MKTKILTILRGTDDYISGQEICDRLGVSRTAVWKVINQLKEEGYVIEAVNNKGYRITEYPDILTQSELESAINIESANGEGTLAKKLVCRDIVDSTNNVARKLAEDMACHGTLVVAEQQTGGKGRRHMGIRACDSRLIKLHCKNPCKIITEQICFPVKCLYEIKILH